MVAVSDLEESVAWQVRVAGLPAPEREYRFSERRRFRFDFAWPDHKVALEVDGGEWVNGRHVRGAGVRRDAEKQCLAAVEGWRVLRANGSMVDDGTVLGFLKEVLL